LVRSWEPRFSCAANAWASRSGRIWIWPSTHFPPHGSLGRIRLFFSPSTIPFSHQPFSSPSATPTAFVPATHLGLDEALYHPAGGAALSLARPSVAPVHRDFSVGLPPVVYAPVRFMLDFSASPTSAIFSSRQDSYGAGCFACSGMCCSSVCVCTQGSAAAHKVLRRCRFSHRSLAAGRELRHGPNASRWP